MVLRARRSLKAGSHDLRCDVRPTEAFRSRRGAHDSIPGSTSSVARSRHIILPLNEAVAHVVDGYAAQAVRPHLVGSARR